MKNKFQKMNKSDLYFAVIQACKKKGINCNDADMKKSFLDNNSYQLISSDGILIESIDLNKLFSEGINSYGKSVAKTSIVITLFPFIIIFLAIISAIIVPAFTPPDIEDSQSTEKLEQVIKGAEG